METLAGKTILITGGTGTIGSALVKEMLASGRPREVRILSRDDTKQFELMQELPQGSPVRFFIGDVRDSKRVKEVVKGTDVIFHVAALKHVIFCEKNPYEAVLTNIIGLQNVIDSASEEKVEKVVCVSTDKAVNPACVMGVTKLMAEKLILTRSVAGLSSTKLCCVRFGNVLWSRGSVLPLFAKQMKTGQEVTLTDPDMSRFFMSIEDAAKLVIKAAAMTRGNEIFVLKMPAVRMGDVAEALKGILLEENLIKHHPKVRIIGPKEGERRHEELLTMEETGRALETDFHYIILPKLDTGKAAAYSRLYKGAKRASIKAYSSEHCNLLRGDELKSLLKKGHFYRKS